MQPGPVVCDYLDRPARSSVLDRRFWLPRRSDAASRKPKRVLYLARCFFPMAFASVDQAGVQKHIGIVGKRLFGNSQFAAGALIVTKAVVVVIRQRKVDFASIRLEAHGTIQGGLCQIKAGRRMIMAPKVCNAMHSGQQTPSS